MTNETFIPTIDWRTKNINTDQQPAIHELHPTWMEQFMKCPYQYHVADRPELFPDVQFWTSTQWREAFYEGDITEQLMTAYQYWDKLWDQVLTQFGNSTEFPTFSRLKKHAENWKEFIKNSSPAIQNRFPLFTQKRMTLRVLMDSDANANNINLPAYHEIWLTGTADWIYSDYTIADCKTAKSKWWKNEPDFRLQWRLYPRMRKVTSNLPNLKKSDSFDFTYFVFTKQVTPQLQVINLNYKYEDSERLIFHLLTEYVKSYDNDEREPKKCLGCKRCPLRTSCPRYAEDWMASFSTPEPAWNINNDSEEWRF